jgi:ABC-type transport system involved in multi-copper enzyme maturation permease subunit
MDLPAVLFAARCLVRDTFRQARASGVTAALAAASAVSVLFCLSVAVHGDPLPTPGESWEAPNILPATEAAKHSATALEGVDVPGGEMTLLFGTIRVPLKRARATEVRFVELILAGGVADTLGVLLALVWTAGFLPSFLDVTTASVVFAKPAARWAIFAGRFVAVVILVAAQALLFIVGVWAALGIRAGVWDVRVFAALPVLVIHFGCFYAVSAALAVFTRSTAATVVGTILTWTACWAVNYARQTASPGLPLDIAYWLLPKPADFGLFLVDVLGAGNYFGGTSINRAAANLNPEAAILTSFALPLAAMAFALWRLKRLAY